VAADQDSLGGTGICVGMDTSVASPGHIPLASQGLTPNVGVAAWFREISNSLPLFLMDHDTKRRDNFGLYLR
jgi:hypothetical protein